MAIFTGFLRNTFFMSQCLGIPLQTEQGTKLGRLTDFFVDYEEIYPSVLAIQFQKSHQLFYISWSDVLDFGRKKIIVKNDAEARRSRVFHKVLTPKVVTSLLAEQFKGESVDYPAIGRVVLDHQVVDTSGKKVVRVNDINFVKVGGNLKVTHAAIGLRSILRRLGFEGIFDFTINFLRLKAKRLHSEPLINWKFVHAIPDKTFQKNIRLGLNNNDIRNLHPADLADILEDLDNHARELIFSNLDPELAAETLSELGEELQTKFISSEIPESAAKILENMAPDEAADVLSELDEDKAQTIIENITDQETKEEIQELLEYKDDTAGGLMSTEVFQVKAETTKSEILKIIQQEHEEIESIYDLYVIDDQERLIGTCSLNRVLINEKDQMVKEIMNSHDIKFLTPKTPWQEVAKYMSKYNLINVPIVDSNNVLLGVISVDDILPWLLDE